MSARSNKFFLRTALAFCASGVCWVLLLMVPAAMQVERTLQRCAHKIFFPSYQQSFGLGTLAQPYTILKLQEPKQVQAPFVVVTGDDPDKIFDTNPLSPSDYAVLLDSIKKSGAERVMIASPLTWQQADPFALDALELVIAQLPLCITSAPVVRAAQTDPIPAAMVRASIPLHRVQGNHRTLPQVNRLAMTDCVLGKENSWAGFSAIESEPSTEGKEFLLALWGDHVIFSSSLLAVLLREQITPNDLMIDVGHAIFSPRTGHWWSIDEFGRGDVSPKDPSTPDLLAQQLIRPEPVDWEKLQHHHPPVHVLDKNGDGTLMKRQQQVLQNLYAAPHVVESIEWHRLPTMSELLVLVFVTSLAILILAYHGPLRILAFLMLAGFWIFTMQWGSTWLPLSPTLLACLVAWGVRPKIVALPSPTPDIQTESKESRWIDLHSSSPARENRRRKKRKSSSDDDISPQLPLDGLD